MRYRYVLVAEMQGLIVTGGPLIVEAPGLNGALTYTADRDAIPEIVDIRGAIASLLLGGLAGRASEDAKVARERAVAQIRLARKSARAVGALAILDVIGEIADFELTHTREDEDFIICLGETPAKAIRVSHERYAQSLLAAISISSPSDVSAKRLAACVIFYTGGGKPIFCYEMEGSANAYVASPITDALAEDANRFALQLSRGTDYSDVNRLLAQSMDMASDQLLSFLSAWTALEIFLNRAFKDYEGSIFAQCQGGKAVAHPEVVRRVRTVMSDKFRLSDKFAAVAGVLDEAGCEDDLKVFMGIKAQRDKLLHGKELLSKQLPSETTRKLVRKYLRHHLEAVRQVG